MISIKELLRLSKVDVEDTITLYLTSGKIIEGKVVKLHGDYIELQLGLELNADNHSLKIRYELIEYFSNYCDSLNDEE